MPGQEKAIDGLSVVSPFWEELPLSIMNVDSSDGVLPSAGALNVVTNTFV